MLVIDAIAVAAVACKAAFMSGRLRPAASAERAAQQVLKRLSKMVSHAVAR
jgi:hypothetical protein